MSKVNNKHTIKTFKNIFLALFYGSDFIVSRLSPQEFRVHSFDRPRTDEWLSRDLVATLWF